MHDYHIVKVAPVPKHLSITWTLGSRCNYECMYCPSHLHDMTSKPHNLEVMQQAWKNMYSKTVHQKLPYKLMFTGGEITVNKNFLPLLKWMRKEYPEIDMILVTTNGSASLKYYQKLAAIVDAISFSTHSEFMNEQEFFKKVIAINKLMVRPQKSCHVNIMDEFWNQDRFEIYKKLLESEQVSYSVNRIDYSYQTRTYPIFKGKLNLNDPAQSF